MKRSELGIAFSSQIQVFEKNIRGLFCTCPCSGWSSSPKPSHLFHAVTQRKNCCFFEKKTEIGFAGFVMCFSRCTSYSDDHSESSRKFDYETIKESVFQQAKALLLKVVETGPPPPPHCIDPRKYVWSRNLARLYALRLTCQKRCQSESCQPWLKQVSWFLITIQFLITTLSWFLITIRTKPKAKIKPDHLN